jgi:hypothetical protein
MARKKTEEQIAREKAARFAELKRQTGPLVAELERLNEELKAYFRSHPETNQLGEVGFAVMQRRHLDIKAVRAALGDRVAQFEKANPVETLYLRGAPAPQAQ